MLKQGLKNALKQRLMQIVMAVIAIAALVTIEAERASAHHGWSEYNNQQTLNLTGQIRSVGYANPHTVIQVEAAGKVWRAVLAPPARMQRRGLPQNALRVGQTVRIVGYPHRSEANEMRAEQIVLSNQTVELR
ncbi:DUF6152 family protein [Leptolyngbya sp. FACHB-261]|uniref:DUF6152 family protein n=1 Tax=Leptolyngbya sp. FACHB-261 TaxID=2692806 RepID=UPI0016888DA3|nr:DUF6152 family protein [Leptolyngbya sp. FACHB-261]MBD2100316.1 hypothetical protein [Leptolyngbya sp. FACHB-261]